MPLFQKVTGSNPQIYRKTFDNGQQHAIIIEKQPDGRPPLYTFNRAPLYVAVWQHATPFEYNKKLRELKTMLNESIQG